MAATEEPLGRVNLCWQIMLSSSLYGLETCLGFYQMYAVLFLRYMGVPLSLVSLDGIVTGLFCIGAIPVTGYLVDRGSNPKVRKMIFLLLGMILLVVSAIFILVVSFMKLNQLLDEGEELEETGNVERRIGANSVNKPGRNVNNSSLKNWQQLSFVSSTIPDINQEIPKNCSATSVSVSAVLAIVGVSVLNMGYDSTASVSRALMLVSVPPSQQTGVLATSTVLQSVSGTIFSTMGILDLPGILGPNLGVDGISATFVIIASYILVCIVTGFVNSTVSSCIIGRRMTVLNGYRQLPGDIKHDHSDRYHHEETSDTPLLSSQVESSCRNNETDLANVRESASFMHNDRSNQLSIAYCKRHDTNQCYLSKSRKQAVNRMFKQKDDVIIKNQSKASVPETDATKLRLNRHLVIVCVSYFFGVGGMMSFILYLPNAVTIGIYQGDPDALPGTEGHTLYQKGLKMAAVGNLTFNVAYLMMSVGNKVILRCIDAEVLNVILSTCFLISFLTFVTLQNEALYFINLVIFGMYRTCIFTIPYVLANKYTQSGQLIEGNSEEQSANPNVSNSDSNANSSNTNATKMGEVMSLIGILMPAHYFLFSTFMGPMLASTNDVWFPLYYGLVNILLANLTFCLLFVWKYSHSP